MSRHSIYCKAYRLSRLKEYPHWRELPSSNPRTGDVDEIVFLHDNYIVTRGIFMDEDLVFTDVTPDWIAYCQTQLQFSVPPDVAGMHASAAAEDSRVDQAALTRA